MKAVILCNAELKKQGGGVLITVNNFSPISVFKVQIGPGEDVSTTFSFSLISRLTFYYLIDRQAK